MYRPAERPQRARDFGDELARALTEDDFSASPVDPEAERSALIKPQDKQSGTKPSIPLWMILASVLLVAGIIGAIVWLRSGSGSSQQANANNINTIPTTATAPRSLVYSLTVQNMDGDNPVGEEYPATGQESFGNGWKFRVNITPAQSGSLYMLNEFNGSGGAVNYNALFPT